MLIPIVAILATKMHQDWDIEACDRYVRQNPGTCDYLVPRGAGVGSFADKPVLGILKLSVSTIVLWLRHVMFFADVSRDIPP